MSAGSELDGMAVEWWPIDRPVDHPENYRTHPEKQLREIRSWLATLGFVRPRPGSRSWIR